jgi:hypothetical protein
MSEKHEPFFRVRKEYYRGYEIHMPVTYYGNGMLSYASVYKDGKFIAGIHGESATKIRQMYKQYIDDKLSQIPKSTERFLK